MDEKYILETEKRYPLVLWDEPDIETFIVTIKAKGLLPLKQSKPHEASNGLAGVDPSKGGMSVLAEVIDAKKKKKTVYTFEVVRFPSPVNWNKTTWKVEKDKVVITLKKKEPKNWMHLVNRRGLDQSSSSSDEEKIEEPLGAVAPRPKKDRVLRLDDLDAGVKRLVIIERTKSKKSDSSSDDENFPVMS